MAQVSDAHLKQAQSAFLRVLFQMVHPVLIHEINSQKNLENSQEVRKHDSESKKDLKIHPMKECFSRSKEKGKWEVFSELPSIKTPLGEELSLRSFGPP